MVQVCLAVSFFKVDSFDCAEGLIKVMDDDLASLQAVLKQWR